MIELILSAVIPIITTLITLFYVEKKAQKLIENTKKDVKREIEDWLNSENGQKALFQIGGLIGNGAKSGFGISSRGGKFKWEDIVAQLAGKYLFRGGQQGQPATPPQGSNDLNIS